MSGYIDEILDQLIQKLSIAGSIGAPTVSSLEAAAVALGVPYELIEPIGRFVTASDAYTVLSTAEDGSTCESEDNDDLQSVMSLLRRHMYDVLCLYTSSHEFRALVEIEPPSMQQSPALEGLTRLLREFHGQSGRRLRTSLEEEQNALQAISVLEGRIARCQVQKVSLESSISKIRLVRSSFPSLSESEISDLKSELSMIEAATAERLAGLTDSFSSSEAREVGVHESRIQEFRSRLNASANRRVTLEASSVSVEREQQSRLLRKKHELAELRDECSHEIESLMSEVRVLETDVRKLEQVYDENQGQLYHLRSAVSLRDSVDAIGKSMESHVRAKAAVQEAAIVLLQSMWRGIKARELYSSLPTDFSKGSKSPKKSGKKK